jgi:hypothetical protein
MPAALGNGMHIKTLDLHALRTVTGGVNGPAPIKPTIPNFGGSRYSADWWAKYNASPAGQAQR